MCSGIRQTVLQTVLALVVGAPVLASALPPAEDASAGRRATVVAQPVRQFVIPESTLPDQATMVLAGTLLIGAAAAVRRAA